MERKGLGGGKWDWKEERGSGVERPAGWGGEEMPKGRVQADNGSLGKMKQSQEWRQAGRRSSKRN